jgi:hypothetical protein
MYASDSETETEASHPNIGIWNSQGEWFPWTVKVSVNTLANEKGLVKISML